MTGTTKDTRHTKPGSPPVADRGDVTRRVGDWLERSGFDLELHVARSLASRGFIVSQSGFYGGPDPGEMIEVDIEGRLVNVELDADADALTFHVVVLVECKKAHLPWVLFSAPVGRRASSVPVNRQTAGLGDRVWVRMAAKQTTDPTPLLRSPLRLGFSLRTALINGTGQPASEGIRAPKQAKLSAEGAVAQLRREAIAWTAAHGLPEDQDSDYEGWILFPMIVLDGQLLECHRLAEEEPTVQGIEHGVLSLPAPSTNLAGLPVDIVTRKGLPRLLDDLLDFSHKAGVELKAIVKQENTRIRKEWRESDRGSDKG